MEQTSGGPAVRTARILVAAALAVSAAAGAPFATAATAPTAPYTAFTIDGTASGIGFDVNEVFVGAQVTPTVDSNTAITFDGSSPDLSPQVGYGTVKLAGAGGAPLTQTDYDLSTGAVTFEIDHGDTAPACAPASGQVSVIDVETDPDTGAITTFAADYAVTCPNGQHLTGALRLNSTADFAAASAAPRNWDFGTQLANGDDSAAWAKTFTLTNRGSLPITYGAATIGPSSHAGAYSITRDSCSGQSVQPGAACSLAVVPHPKAVSASPVLSTLTLPTTAPAGLGARLVQLRLQGSTAAGIDAEPGPGHVELRWGQPERPIGAPVSTWQLYRGTSASTLKPDRTTAVRQLNDTAVTGGSVYYYAVTPVYQSGQLGTRTPVVATKPWPKYMAGMYHRLSHPVRFAGAHPVTAGHPYSLHIGGAHGVPSGHVAAVAVQVLAQNPTQDTSLTLYPADAGRPAQPDVRLSRGMMRSNFALVKVSAGGWIKIANEQGTVSVSVDVSGYYSAAGLPASYGTGGAYFTYEAPGTILDTKAWNIGALPHDYYINAPVNFTATDTPHVKSLAVQITAYGSTGSGTITAFASNAGASSTQVLAYAPNTTTTNFAIVPAGLVYVSGRNYPSISLLNRGSRSVQLIMTIVGFYDDDFYTYGERYVPTAPQRLSITNPMYAGSRRTLGAGYTHADIWTTSLNLHVSARGPSRSTTLKLWPRLTGVTAPPHGQVAVPARVDTLASTVAPLGVGNQAYLSNAAGTVTVTVWSFGRFDAYGQPAQRNYASAAGLPVSPSAAAPGPVRTVARARRLR
jgi:hypothetical protein